MRCRRTIRVCIRTIRFFAH